jgi:dihydropteroate synthase
MIPHPWQLSSQKLEFDRGPALMGIVNVTPDSFSDGGKFSDTQSAIDHALQLEQQGAAILDIGGESTRPYSDTVSAADELRRVIPVIRGLSRQASVPISIDTRKPEVAQAALDEGAQILNDVEGFRNPQMVALAAASGAGVCVMHMQGLPLTMQDNPTYRDVVADVRAYLIAQRQLLIDAGVAANRICIDPGIGFGKSTQHNLELLQAIAEFVSIGAPVLVGHSRKGFLGKLVGDPDCDRTAATIGVSLAMAQQGVSVLRVHDVGPMQQALVTYLASQHSTSHPIPRTKKPGP